MKPPPYTEIAQNRKDVSSGASRRAGQRPPSRPLHVSATCLYTCNTLPPLRLPYHRLNKIETNRISSCLLCRVSGTCAKYAVRGRGLRAGTPLPAGWQPPRPAAISPTPARRPATVATSAVGATAGPVRLIRALIPRRGRLGQITLTGRQQQQRRRGGTNWGAVTATAPPWCVSPARCAPLLLHPPPRHPPAPWNPPSSCCR